LNIAHVIEVEFAQINQRGNLFDSVDFATGVDFELLQVTEILNTFQ
jgi:hypothetical protein